MSFKRKKTKHGPEYCDTHFYYYLSLCSNYISQYKSVIAVIASERIIRHRLMLHSVTSIYISATYYPLNRR